MLWFINLLTILSAFFGGILRKAHTHNIIQQDNPVENVCGGGGNPVGNLPGDGG